MRFWFFGIIMLLGAGCAHIDIIHDETISTKLPLSIRDIDEIRAGDDAHKQFFDAQNLYQEPKYKLFTSPELHAYVTQIGMRLARVSDRPDLPYRFFIIDSDEVDLFGLGGGRVYITRGFFSFIDSESELAGGIAHEIGHIANYEYASVQGSKIKKGYDALMKVSDQTHGFTGHYGGAANTGLRAIGNAAPYVKKKFEGDTEKKADRVAVRYMIKAGYDPKGLYQLVEKLSEVDIENVGNFVDFMKSHPPFKKRRDQLRNLTANSKFIPRPRLMVRNDELITVPAPVEILDTKPAAPAAAVKKIAEVTSTQSNLPVVEARALAPQS